ncbi:MAG TPA: PA2778 family cysteine peptidase, partial [Burkholderiales bacterium]|nr:PA2778 family cysteine peptidase [Burkholderiales bacterium]
HLLQLETDALMQSKISMSKSARLVAGVFALVSALLSGCVGIIAPQATVLRDDWPADLPKKVELTEVPFFPQEDYQCGPAALATSMSHFNVNVTPEQLVSQVYLPARQGSLQLEMLATPRRFGLVSYLLAPRYEDLLREVAAGNPVVVLQNQNSEWHYAVVAGYDGVEGMMVLRSGKVKRQEMQFFVLEYTWANTGYWALVTMPPDRIPVTATEPEYLAAVVAMARVGAPPAVQTAYRTFLERWPDNVTAAIGLANSYHAQGQLNAAEAVLRGAVERHPDSDAAMNNLAQALSDEGKNDEALAIIERAVALAGPYASAALQTRDIIVQRRAQKN